MGYVINFKFNFNFNIHGVRTMKSTKSSHDNVMTPQVMSKAVMTGITNNASWSCSSTMAQRNWPSGRRPMMTNLRGTRLSDGDDA